MKFWDSSAIVPLLIMEPSSARVQAIAAQDEDMRVWWGTVVECASALAREERRGALKSGAVSLALDNLEQLAARWDEVDPSEPLRLVARRFLRVHHLRAADAFQLAAAFEAADHNPPAMEFVTLDHDLAVAARREGFRLTLPAPGP
jgi:predicted nucleic acid-binding protein